MLYKTVYKNGKGRQKLRNILIVQIDEIELKYALHVANNIYNRPIVDRLLVFLTEKLFIEMDISCLGFSMVESLIVESLIVVGYDGSMS